VRAILAGKPDDGITNRVTYLPTLIGIYAKLTQCLYQLFVPSASLGAEYHDRRVEVNARKHGDTCLAAE
jgi:hypothetical protein